MSAASTRAPTKVTATFTKAAWAVAVALDHGSFWFATTATHQLGRIDARTNKIDCLLTLPGPAFGMTAGAGATWTTDRDDGPLFKVIPATPAGAGTDSRARSRVAGKSWKGRDSDVADVRPGLG